VAAYARISQENERMIHSLSAQVSYYSELIQKNPDWEYAGVYADSGISGTGIKNRAEFLRMLQDCEDGKIDIILTKSIGRFARNTVDLLQTVRHLKEIGVAVRFEKENIDSLSDDGELMLTLIASIAQAEAESTSQNVRWAKRKMAEKGIMTTSIAPYGYRCEGRNLVVIPEQAKVVRRVFKEYIEDERSTEAIARRLNEDNVPGQMCGAWWGGTIYRMLSNVAYTGDLLLLKYFTKDPLTHKSVKNMGEQPMYYVENDHEAIISHEVFEKAQERKKLNSELGVFVDKNRTFCEFTKRIMGNAEENAFITGDGTGKPTGILDGTSGAEVGVTAASETAVTFDEVFALYYALKAPYRKKAAFLCNEALLLQLMTLKDKNDNYIWKPSLEIGKPNTLLGRPIHTSAYMPAIAAGNKALLFGDYSYYWIADRQNRTFKRLNELYARTDQVGFISTQRVDGKLILREAVQALQMSGTSAAKITASTTKTKAATA